MKPSFLTAFALATALLSGCGGTEPAANDPTAGEAETPTLTIYSARHYDSDRLLYEAYEDATGVNVDVREAGADQLLETMRAEGSNSPADLVIASDAGALWRFQDAGLLQPLSDPELEAAVPESLRDPDGHWFGVARRLRLVAYDPELVTEGQIKLWSDLTAPEFEDEICVRASSNIYNLSLLAEMIEQQGAETAQAWASGIADNMARDPQGGDTDQIRALAAGECSVAIVNHYYWLRLAESSVERDQEVAAATRLVVPEFAEGSGAHVNITGAAVTATATAEDAALAADFIAFLLSDEGQELLTVETRELPLKTDGESGDALPDYTASGTPLSVYGRNQAEAQRLYDLAGWK